MMMTHPNRRSLLVAANYSLTALALNDFRQSHAVRAQTSMRLMD
jgi:hypothetical protein